MKHYIVTEEDVENLKSRLNSDSGYWWVENQIDDWVDYLRKQNNK